VQKQVTIQPPTTPGGAVTITETPVGTPQTRAEFDQLHFRREQLRDQVNSYAGRREALRNELKTADAGARTALQARIQELDARIIRTDDEIDRIGERIANTPAHVFASQSAVDPARIADRVVKDLVPLAGIFSVFVLFPITLAIVRMVWKRSSGPPRSVAEQAAMKQQLEQIQQSIDTIAVEVERISEGQRYVARVMNERQLGAGSAEAVVPLQSAMPIERR
jgi:DNA repair exonuclease SbcCD ATPase subunit